MHAYAKKCSGADPEIFERGSPEAIIHKILERGGPNSLKMAFECSFQSFSYKSFANIPPKGGARAPWAPPLNPPLVFCHIFVSFFNNFLYFKLLRMMTAALSKFVYQFTSNLKYLRPNLY